METAQSLNIERLYHFTEPSAVYMNVAGGLGIFGSFQSGAVSLDMPVQDREW
ncbi:MAG: DUF4249 domain-containing protein [Tannerella sp.]|jgi:hypothetical protein|nr:DUF4249 domain-containing protein [Tannerella sp.]